MRTYGRIPNDSSPTGFSWVEVTTDKNGSNDAVWLTTLCQCLKLNTGESPFFANFGIPAYQTIVTQVMPDYYVSLTQQQFSQYFASLSISRVPGASAPIYNVAAMTHSGTIISGPIPQ